MCPEPVTSGPRGEAQGKAPPLGVVPSWGLLCYLGPGSWHPCLPTGTRPLSPPESSPSFVYCLPRLCDECHLSSSRGHPGCAAHAARGARCLQTEAGCQRRGGKPWGPAFSTQRWAAWLSLHFCAPCSHHVLQPRLPPGPSCWSGPPWASVCVHARVYAHELWACARLHPAGQRSPAGSEHRGSEDGTME